MKKLVLLPAFLLMLGSCQKESTCTCKDANGTLVKQSSEKSNKKDIEQFEKDCRDLKVQSYDSKGNVVLTPCVVG